MAKADRQVVLVIDDDPAVLGSLQFSLEIEGYDARVFRSGEELLDQAEVPESGCVVIDFRLPGMDGIDLWTSLKARGIDMPGILVTSFPNEALRRRAAAAGIPIVEKPFLGNSLIDAINQATG